jgi:hypothetical protein
MIRNITRAAFARLHKRAGRCERSPRRSTERADKQALLHPERSTLRLQFRKMLFCAGSLIGAAKRPTTFA